MNFGIQKPFGGTNSEEIARHYRQFLPEEKIKEEPSKEDTLRQIRNENSEYICPISFDLLLDPVICNDGHSYERKNIELWLKNHNTSPKTNSVLESKILIPNHALRNSIETLVEKEQINFILVEEWLERKKILKKERKAQERRDKINNQSNKARQQLRELMIESPAVLNDERIVQESSSDERIVQESSSDERIVQESSGEESYDEDVI